MSQKPSGIFKAGAKLSLLTLVSRVLGLIREMTKASFLGTSALADAFGVAFMIPNLFRRLFAENSISVAFIPTFRSYLEDSDKKTTQEFVSATFTLISFLTTLVVIIGICATPLIIPFFTDGTDTSIIPEMTLLTRMMFPYLAIISVAAFFQGILNSLRIFSPSGFTPILFNILVIGLTYLLSPFTANPARAMAYGVLAGGLVQAAFQLPFVLKTGWHTSFTSLKKAFTNPGTKKVLRLVGPTIIGMAAYQLNDVVSTALAGQAGTGVVSSLQYSLRLQELILGIFAVSIGTVILPDLSASAKSKQWTTFNDLLKKAMNSIALITIPIMVFAFLMGEEIIVLVFKSNRFTAESVRLTKEAFMFHMAGLLFIALNRIIAPAFYAQENTKLPTLAGIIGFVVNICLALLLVGPMRGGGIALALSLASLANTIALFAFLGKTQTVEVKPVIASTLLYSLKMCILSIVSIIPIYFLKPFLCGLFAGKNRLIAQGVPLFAAVCIYGTIGLFLLFITKDPLIKSLINRRKK